MWWKRDQRSVALVVLYGGAGEDGGDIHGDRERAEAPENQGFSRIEDCSAN